MFRFAFNSV